MISSIVNDAISFILSLIVLSYCLYTLDLVSIFGCILAVVVPMFIKSLTKNTPFPEIFKRPDGAKDCNLFNTGGPCDRDSGFPSGHVTLISYFCFYIYYQYNKELMNYLYGRVEGESDVSTAVFTTKERWTLYLICFIPIIMMGYARYMKRCHNTIQVLFGAITGFLISKFILKFR